MANTEAKTQTNHNYEEDEHLRRAISKLIANSTIRRRAILLDLLPSKPQHDFTNHNSDEDERLQDATSNCIAKSAILLDISPTKPFFEEGTHHHNYDEDEHLKRLMLEAFSNSPIPQRAILLNLSPTKLPLDWTNRHCNVEEKSLKMAVTSSVIANSSKISHQSILFGPPLLKPLPHDEDERLKKVISKVIANSTVPRRAILLDPPPPMYPRKSRKKVIFEKQRKKSRQAKLRQKFSPLMAKSLKTYKILCHKK